MGPIAPIGLAGAPGGQEITGARDATAGVHASRPSAAFGLTQFHAAISQMLQNIGGGLETDKTLRMLIGLIILLALLGELRNSGDSPRAALTPLDVGSQARVAGLTASYSTIEVHQTSTTILLGSTGAYAGAGDEDSNLGPFGGFEAVA